jgi:hypothetical protein
MTAIDYGAKAHQVAIDHLNQCMDSMDAEEADAEPDDVASAPFDGCLDCMVRETLFAASPVLEAGILSDHGHTCTDRCG